MDLSATGPSHVVMIKLLVNFRHCPLHEEGFVDFCCLGVSNLFSLTPFPAQLVAHSAVIGVSDG